MYLQHGVRKLKTVYADVVFFANFVTDYIILYLSFSFLHLNIGFIRIILSCVAGGVFSVFCALTNLSGFIKISVSFAFLLFMLFINLGRQKIKNYLKTVIVVYTFSILLGGIVLMFDGGKNNEVSALLFAFCLLFLIVSHRVFGNLFRSVQTERYVDASVGIYGKTYNLKLLCDSGNVLVDPYTSLPVVVLKKEAFGEACFERMRQVPFRTVSGVGVMRVMIPDKTQLIKNGNRVEVKAAIGFCDNVSADFIGFDGIIPGNLCEYI